MHTRKCSEAYQRAYRALAAARNLEENSTSLLKELFDNQKLIRRTEGIIAREIKGRGSGGDNRYRFMGSITHKGFVWCFDTVESLCPRIYHLYDNFGFASPMLEHILTAANAKGYSAIICPNTERVNLIHHLLIPELGIAFLTVNSDMKCTCKSYRRIHLDAMVDQTQKNRWKGRLRFLEKMIRTLREDGITALKEAKESHDALEAVYRPNVDFKGIDQLTTLEIKRMESYL